jgi:hypothetical protein
MHAGVPACPAKVRATFEPYGGTFRAHGEPPRVVESA